MFAAAKRIIVIGDIHGDIMRLLTCLRAALVINEANAWIAQPPDTFVVQLGDQLDGKHRDAGGGGMGGGGMGGGDMGGGLPGSMATPFGVPAADEPSGDSSWSLSLM